MIKDFLNKVFFECYGKFSILMIYYIRKKT